MGDTRSAFAAEPTFPPSDDLSEIDRILAEAGIDGSPETAADAPHDPAVLPASDETALLDGRQEVVPVHAEAEDLKFGCSYPDSASANDLIIGSDGTGYLYPSDFVHGTNGYHR